MTFPSGFELNEIDTGVGVLHLAKPGETSRFTLLHRTDKKYTVERHYAYERGYSSIPLPGPEFKPYRSHKTLFFDVTQVGLHFLEYIRQVGIQNIVPIVCMEPQGLNPWEAKPDRKGLLFVSLREAEVVLQLLIDFGLLDLRHYTFGYENEEEVERALQRFGIEEALKIHPRLHSLAVATLVAEKIESIVQ